MTEMKLFLFTVYNLDSEKFEAGVLTAKDREEAEELLIEALGGNDFTEFSDVTLTRVKGIGPYKVQLVRDKKPLEIKYIPQDDET